MRYSIVFSSKTGNTALLAQAIAFCLPEGSCLYHGVPDDAATQSDVLFAGFWTDKGSCDEGMAAFLQRLHGKKVFLFGTAGFGGDPAYFDGILNRVAAYLPADNTVIGRYMCQGKMPAGVRARYEAMAAQDPQRFLPMLENFDRALSHPDTADLDKLTEAVQRCL